MAWSSDFLAGLAAGMQRLYLVNVRQVGDVGGIAGLLAATVPGLAPAQIGDRGVVVNGPQLSPGSWTSTLGTASVVIVGDGLAELKRSVTRGTFVEVMCGFPGWAASDYQRIFCGQVQQLRSNGRASAVLEIRDLQSALQCRPFMGAGRAVLFYADDTITTLTTAYVVGDTTLTVADTSDFEKIDDPAYDGGLWVDNGTDDPFLLRWSEATSATAFALSGAGADQHGTVRVAAPIGSTVRCVFFVEAHPIDAARWLLTSTTGDAPLPVSWGFRLPADWIDEADCDDYKLNSLDTMVWEFLLDQQQDTPLSWLTGLLSAGGFYLTMRQGALTVRAGLMSTLESSGVSVLSITAGRDQMALDDTDIASITWEAWDADVPAEYVNATAYSAGGNSSAGTEDPATLPVIYRQEFDLSAVL